MRLHWQDGTRERARLAAPLAPDSLQVRYCRYPTAHPTCADSSQMPWQTRPLASLRRLEVRRRGSAARGAVFGGVAGVLGGLLVALAPNEISPAPSGGEIAAVSIGGGLTWAGIGALIARSSDRWVPAPAPAP